MGDLIQKNGKKECYDYFLQILKSMKCIGYKNKIEKVEIDGLCGTVRVEVEVINDENKMLDKMSMEESFELNEDGECVRFISISQDYQIVKLSKKRYLFKSMKDHADDAGVTLICYDDDFNKVQ